MSDLTNLLSRLGDGPDPVVDEATARRDLLRGRAAARRRNLRAGVGALGFAALATIGVTVTVVGHQGAVPSATPSQSPDSGDTAKESIESGKLSLVSVTTAKDGDLVVTMTGPADADKLEAALTEHGLNVDVIYAPGKFKDPEEKGKTDQALGGSLVIGEVEDLTPEDCGSDCVFEGPPFRYEPGKDTLVVTWDRTEEGSVMRIEGAVADDTSWEIYLDKHGVTALGQPDASD